MSELTDTIDKIISKIPTTTEDDQSKYGNALASLLALQATAGKFEQEKGILSAEVGQLEDRKTTLSEGYSNQLQYRNDLLMDDQRAKQERMQADPRNQGEAKILQEYLASHPQSKF